MKPKQKAKELVNKYWDIEDIDFLKSKECALISVDEILNEIQINYNQERIDYYLDVINKINEL